MLGGEVMAAALIERILHHCDIVNIRGYSYRIRAQQDLLSGPGRTTRAGAAWHETRRTLAGRVLGGAVLRGSDGSSGRLGVAISVGYGQAERAKRQRSSPAWAETARGLGSPQANRARPKAAPTWKAKNDLVDHKDAGSIPARAAEVGSAEEIG